MRSLTIVAAVIFLTASASAADLASPETVTVESDSPVGLWKFSLPQGFDLHGVVGKAEWGPMADEFCQIEKMRAELMVHCLGLRVGGRDVSRGNLSINDGHIRMVWGSMWTHLTINGTMRSAEQFDGTVSVSHLGISADDPDKVTGTKLFLTANTPDSGGKSALLTRLLDQMTEGTVTEATPTSNAIPNESGTHIRFLKSATLEALGERRSITYLGDGGPSPPLSFYDVEFANGHLICSLRQNSEGRLDRFDCG